MEYTGIAYSVKRLAERGLWQRPGIKMLAHHNAVQAARSDRKVTIEYV